MSRISFTITDEERAEIERYVKCKKRWRDPAALARDAVWQLILRNPLHARKAHGGAQKPSGGSLSLLA